MIYLIGSLRNPEIPVLANNLRALGFTVFDDWYSAGPEADDKWQEYEQGRERPFRDALLGAHARDVYEFDKAHLDQSNVAVLVLPAGKSGHLELGYMAGRGKLTFIFMDGEPERYDVMYNFADAVHTRYEDLVDALTRAGERHVDTAPRSRRRTR